MARPWRIEFPQAVYHVTARGNNRADIVRDDHDRREFIALLAAAALRFNLKIFAFCLMQNHYHLFLRTPDANLSRAMHWLNATYTIRFNRRRRHGHVFQGRYKSMLVADTAHWSVLSIYIHLNPVRAGMAAQAADYEWSSARDYTRSRYDWLAPADVLAPYGSTPAARRKKYGAELAALSAERRGFWDDFQAAVSAAAKEAMEELVPTHPPRGDRATVPDFKRRSARRRSGSGLDIGHLIEYKEMFYFPLQGRGAVMGPCPRVGRGRPTQGDDNMTSSRWKRRTTGPASPFGRKEESRLKSLLQIEINLCRSRGA